ncbi:RNA 2',3'-cyclic phosphodiesterase [Alicyclobacillus dauci]|uniref:RNA 2',3'-cyclic phosphodiesterase n=1 Tax=Alicyclobacillus dauci TaxID=1475485 RepID=A0ABY6Z080_9BACL|nr:RNA 2',3'-cyclic phosphodiesterase [Alicyclobacillus dauci]WAH35744.1 RNA 2',3'-cyclic phosphodiesterase [Alicyclobacillus dauci]
MRRLFFGLELPDDWKENLRHLQSTLQTHHVDASAWSNPSLLHITVLFLGLVPEEQLPLIVDAGQAAATSSSPIRLTSGDYGQFSRNKVFWLGLRRNDTDWEKLVHLHESVKKEVLSRMSLDLDEKHYKPHITMARKLRAQVDVDKLAAPAAMKTTIPDLCLFESLRIDGQLSYPVRARFPLGSQ